MLRTAETCLEWSGKLHAKTAIRTERNHRFPMSFAFADACTTKLHRSSSRSRECARAWVTSDYVTSVPCRISRLPTALSRCWDNGSIRMDHDPGLDVPGTLEINACIMIPVVLFHRRRRRGNGLFLVHLPCFRIESIVNHRERYLFNRRTVRTCPRFTGSTWLRVWHVRVARSSQMRVVMAFITNVKLNITGDLINYI